MNQAPGTMKIDGKAFAEKLRADIAVRVAKLKTEKNITPGLAAVRVGDDPASEVYVRNKVKHTKEAGMNSYEFHMPDSTTQEELLAKVAELNADKNVHGILVQLPLPNQIDEQTIIAAIDPAKDVDGFHPVNVGKLSIGLDSLIPCTPLGCLMLLQWVLGDRCLVPGIETGTSHQAPGTLAGLHAAVIGRSNIVGKPMAALLLKESCTVTSAHSKTKDLPALLKTADIVVAAIGKPKFVKGEWLKKGCVVIDVGINRVPPLTSPPQAGGTEGGRLVGDVDYDSCLNIASAITPVPGGVGPMTIACLLENTLRAAISSSVS